MRSAYFKLSKLFLLNEIKTIEKNPSNKIINLKWMYEDGDDEMLESGEIFQEILPRFSFTFHKFAELDN